MKSKTAIALIFAFLIAVFSGCDSGDPPTAGETIEKQPAVNTVNADGQWRGEGGCYKLRSFDAQDGLLHVFTEGGDIYTISADWFNDRLTIKRNSEIIYTGGADSFPVAATAHNGNFWGVFSDRLEQGNYRKRIVKLDSKGEELLSKDVSGIPIPDWRSDIEIDTAGNIIIASDTGIIVLDSNAELKMLSDIESLTGLIRGGDGEVYAVTNADYGVYTVKAINPSSGNITPVYEDKMLISEGGEGYRFLCADSNGLYGIPMDLGDKVTIALWDECMTGLDIMCWIRLTHLK